MKEQGKARSRAKIQELRALLALQARFDATLEYPREQSCRYDGKLFVYSCRDQKGEFIYFLENKDRSKESLSVQLKEGTVFIDVEKVDALVALSRKWLGRFKETRVYLTQTDEDKAVAIRLSTNDARTDRAKGLEWARAKRWVPSGNGRTKTLKTFYAIPLADVEFEFDLEPLADELPPHSFGG